MRAWTKARQVKGQGRSTLFELPKSQYFFTKQ